MDFPPSAKQMISAGVACFPLAPNGYPPALKRLPPGTSRSGQHLATTNQEEFDSLVAWLNSRYTNEVSAYGCRGGKGLAIIDLDVKDGRDGVGRFFDFCRERGWLENVQRTLQVATPSGGRHIYLRTPVRTKVPTGTCLDGLIGVDFRGFTGWAAGPGSYIKDKGSYSFIGENRTIRRAPRDMTDWITAARPMGMGGGSGGSGGSLRFFSYVEAVEHWTPFVMESGGKVPAGVQNSCLVDLAWGACCDSKEVYKLEDAEAVAYVTERLELGYSHCNPPYSKEAPAVMALRMVTAWNRKGRI